VTTEITIDDFNKLDLRVAKNRQGRARRGRRQAAESSRSILAAARALSSPASSPAYAPEKLDGQLAVLVANLAPRKMKFGISEGMVLCASGEGPGIYLIAPDSGAQPGMRVK
jgi:methionyl-tRNA synthetase